MFVAAAGVHRQHALLACEFMIDKLKRDAPSWKK
ncbi:MAG: molybdenum cofactor biosynthesis protein MoaE [Gammaproteobacteria bacterium]